MATIVKGKNPKKPHTVRYSTQSHDAKCKPGCQIKYHQREASFATATEAKDFKAKFEHDSRANIFVDPKLGQVDFCDYAASWIESLDRAESTKRTYRSVLNARIRPAFTGRTLAQVASDREGVWSFVSKSDLSSSRKTSCLTVITGSLDEAVLSGRITSHKLAGLTVRKDAQEPAVIIPATKDELTKLADDMKPELDLLVWLMRGCGLRISEALAVNLNGFREGGKVLRIHEQVTQDGSLGPLKHRRPGESRDVPVPSWLWSKVGDHVSEFGTDNGYLFGHDGKRVRYNTAYTSFMKAAKLAGFSEEFTPHQLRHLFVSALLNAGVPISDVATWVGHRDINVTHAVYGHLLPDSWTRGRNALESL